MLAKLKKILGKTYHPLNRIMLSSQNLYHNYTYLSAIDTRVAIAPVVKSNAYGHGLTQIAPIVDTLKAPFICVDSIYEAYELLKLDVKTKILIMGYIDPENLKVKKLPFSYAVYDTTLLEVINTYQKGAGVHIKVDTGMHRLGIQTEDLPEFLSTIKQYDNIDIEGLMAHFAYAEKPNDSLTKLQIANFQKARTILQEFNIQPKWFHYGGSNAILNASPLHTHEFANMARVGLALYGIDSRDEENDRLWPILRLTTKIVQIKQLAKGDRVGYCGTFTAPKDMVIGVLPIGFYDGIDRRLSNKGIMYIDDIPCPIVGRVSMNITTIDISGVSNPTIGQEVEIIGRDSERKNSLFHSANLAGTSTYDLAVHMAASTKRDVE